MKKILPIILIVAIALVSCNEKNILKQQPTVLENNAAFDLEAITFDEDVAKLFSKSPFEYHILYHESENDKKIPDSIFKYNIESYLAETFKMKVPVNDFGYLYKSRPMDSIAKIESLYFSQISVLTNLQKKAVAYSGEARLDTKTQKDAFIKEFKNAYGTPKYAFQIDTSFDQQSFEWELEDRTFQIATSKGFEMSISTNEDAKSGEYYRIDVLIIDNKSKDAIYKAHILELPEKINLKGKIDTTITYTSLKELGMEQVNIIEDDFLLNSYLEKYTKDEYGEHTIYEEE